jgi:Fic family protein
MTFHIQHLLIRILEKKARYDAKKPFPKVMEESFYEASRIELTYHSNAIEGNTLTLADTALVIHEKISIPGKQLREIYEARNHEQALSYIESMVRDGRDMTEDDILRIHEIILRDIDDEYAGRYRDMHVRITGSIVVLPNPLKVPSLM